MHYIDDNCTRKAEQSCMFEKPSITTSELIISVNNLVNKAEFNYQIQCISYKNPYIHCRTIMYNVCIKMTHLRQKKKYKVHMYPRSFFLIVYSYLGLEWTLSCEIKNMVEMSSIFADLNEDSWRIVGVMCVNVLPKITTCGELRYCSNYFLACAV